MWLTDVIPAVCGIGTDGLDVWPDNETMDGVCLEDSLLIDWRSSINQHWPGNLLQGGVKVKGDELA